MGNEDTRMTNRPPRYLRRPESTSKRRYGAGCPLVPPNRVAASYGRLRGFLGIAQARLAGYHPAMPPGQRTGTRRFIIAVAVGLCLTAMVTAVFGKLLITVWLMSGSTVGR